MKPPDVDLKRIPLFAECTPATLERWRRGSVLKQYKTGALILKEGGASAHVYTLISGVVRVFFTGRDDKKIVAKLFSGPAFFGEMESLTNIPHLENVDVLQSAWALQTPRALLIQTLREDHGFTARLLLDVCARFCVAAHLEKCTAFNGVESRLASMLLSYSQIWGVPNGKALGIARPLTLNELAEGLGVTRKSVERGLAQFEKNRWVTRSGKLFTLLDLAALQNLSGELQLGVDYSLLRASERSEAAWKDLSGFSEVTNSQ